MKLRNCTSTALSSYLTLAVLLLPAQSFASAETCNIQKTLFSALFDSNVSDPLAELKITRREMDEFITEFNAWQATKGTEGYFERAGPIYGKWVDGYLRAVKEGAEHSKSLLKLAKNSGGHLALEVDERLKSLDEYIEKLPHTYADKDPAISYKNMESLLQSWAKINGAINIQEVIKLVRLHDPKLLASAEFQTPMRQLFSGGIGLLLRQSMTNRLVYEEPLHLFTLFKSNMKSYDWGTNLFFLEKNSQNVSIVTNHHLFNEMMRELTFNAKGATQRRFIKEGKEFNGWVHGPRVEVKNVESGAVVAIHDQGYPEDFTLATGLAQSRDFDRGAYGGLGLGRFRSSVIADYLGFQLSHRPEVDGSGSVIEIFIPKSHLK